MWKICVLVIAGVLSLVSSLEARAQATHAPPVTLADGARSQEGARNHNGRWVLPDGTPTHHVTQDRIVDWPAYSGFRRYHDAGGCMQCHGPDGEGSTYGSTLINSLKTMSFDEFIDVVARGQLNGVSVMPPFDGNRNIMCYIDDIYVYLKARSDGVLPRGRPRPEASRCQRPRPRLRIPLSH